MDEDKGWDEYDDCDDDELSDENEEDKKDEKNNEYINQKQYSSNNGYNKSNNNGYYGYNNNYSYGGPTKKYRKKGNKKYYSKENESQFTNKNRQYNKDLGSGYKNISHDFVNTNSNYMRNPNIDDNNHKNYNSNTYGKSRSYANRDKNKNNWGFYGGGKKIENEVVSKPMFINSKLKNNGNPEGNFVKIDVNPEEKKHFSLTNIGEINVNDNQSNSILSIKSLLVGKEPEKKIKNSEEKTNENKNNEIESKAYNNNSFNNDNSSSLPWRSGSGSHFGERGGGGYKKDYYNKTYRSNKKDNSYFYNSGKNYNKNRYSLNQPQSKRSNKFD